MLAAPKLICGVLVFVSAALADGPRKISQSEALASVVTKVAPEYPDLAKQLKISGAVELEVVIGENGQVESVKPLTGNPVLTRPAADALRKWKFKPFLQDGAPTKVQAAFKVSFTN